MRDLEVPAQEKLLDLLSNKLSKVGQYIANPTKTSEAVCGSVRRYRHKVVLDLKRLYNQSKSDPQNMGNKMTALLKDLETQNKVREAHENTIEDQKKLIDELMARNKGNPALDRVRKGSYGRASPLPPLRTATPNSNTSMFQLTLGDDSGGMSPGMSPHPRGGRGGMNMGGGRGGMNMGGGRGGMNMGGGRGGRGDMSSWAPQFNRGGPRGGPRGGFGRGARGGRRGFGRF